MSQDTTLQFFLGANTSNGFVSYFPSCYSKDYTVFILKGTPGSGKSTLLKKLAAQSSEPCERIFCSSDPDSLDGVIFPNRHIVVLDGTAPHVRSANRHKKFLMRRSCTKTPLPKHMSWERCFVCRFCFWTKHFIGMLRHPSYAQLFTSFKKSLFSCSK